MRGLTRRWVLRNPAEPDTPPGAPLFDRVLLARGLTDPETIRRFCEPKLTDLHEPQLIPNMDDAAARLVAAVRARESVVIYGDYDVDGITGCAILYHVIRCVAPDLEVRTYVPHRLEEGYGLNCAALRQLKTEGADLVISVDCGITAVDAARTAREIGLDLIITDHHNLPQEMDTPDQGAVPKCAPGAETVREDVPQASPPSGTAVGRVVVVHPRLPGSVYPFGDLCGAGVAFKLAWRFATTWCGSPRVSKSLQQVLLDMLPLAALGTIADVVPLLDENRTIATFGLRRIKQTPIAGLRALIEASDLLDEHIDSEKVGFVLGPRLNACGRMGHAAEAVRMLTTASPEEARAIARRLTDLNRQRQDTQRRILDHAVGLAEDLGMTTDDRRAIVLADESWHPGVLGIVCTRLTERYGRPAVLLQQRGEVCQGSARSIEGYSIHAALVSTAQHLTRFGGHDAAAGLTLPTAGLAAFTEALIEHANAHISVEQLIPSIRIDCDAALDELDLRTVKRIGELSPFGRANPRPTVRLQGTTLDEPPRQIGSYGKHLALRLRQDSPAGRRWLRLVWWNAGSLASDLAAGMRLDAVIEPKLNEFNGKVTVEGVVRDVRICPA